MKVKIDWCEHKTSKNGKAYMTATVTDEQNVKHDVSIWPDFPYFSEIKPGATVEGNITTKGQYKNLISGSRALNPNYKTAQIEQAQERKAQSIEAAQDRSSWMWAKTNAATLIGDSMKSETNEKIAERVIDLATKIHNGELKVPF